MPPLPSEEVIIEMECIHPEYPNHYWLEMTFKVDLYYEPAEPSVGIMNGNIIEDGMLLQKAILMTEEQDKKFNIDIDPDIVELLYPKYLWESIQEDAIELAIEQTSERRDDDYINP